MNHSCTSLNRRCVSGIRLLVIGLLVLTQPGCVYRSLTIRTEPAGAAVYLNDALLKEPSPVQIDFLWYGWYRVAIRKEGYAQLRDRRMLRAPVYLWIPFDLVMELLPWNFRDERTWDYTLSPEQDLPVPAPPLRVPPAGE